MNHAQLINYSLSKQHVEKLIVFLGSGGAVNSAVPRGAVSSRVVELLLRNCRPSLSDVHDPDKTRVHGRDDKGEPRAFYKAYTDAQSAHGRHPRRGRRERSASAQARLRSPQTWDSEPVSDYMGRWCDRLLLGDHQRPLRCAVLQPLVPLQMEGEALLRVAQSHHRRLNRADLLLVTACADLPFGVVRQDQVDLTVTDTGGGVSKEATAPGEGSFSGFATLPQALRSFPPPRSATASQGCASLLIGVGDSAGPREPFTAEEERRLKQCLLPLLSFSCALWATNPARNASYLAEQTPTPTHLSAHNANLRLWSSMQAAMLSTRDAALLQAHFKGELLDARLSPQQQAYLAETLLSRLTEGSPQEGVFPSS